MIENLVIVSKVEDVKRRTNVKANELCGLVKTPFIVSGGDLAWVIKLDKNLPIYVHGARELIEQGVDEEGRKFYKIYYKEES